MTPHPVPNPPAEGGSYIYDPQTGTLVREEAVIDSSTEPVPTEPDPPAVPADAPAPRRKRGTEE